MFSFVVSLLFTFDIYAYTVNIHNSEPIELERVKIISGKQVISGILQKDTPIRFSNSNTLNVPKGSRIGFYPKTNLGTDVYKVYDIVIAAPMTSQYWKYSDELSLKINCGKQPGKGASFVFFSALGHLDEGCVTTEEALFEDDESYLLVGSKSRFKVNAAGKLTYAKKVLQGYVSINNQRVSLYPRKSISYHENGRIRLFHMDKDATLTASTEFGDITFGQKVGNTVFPTSFHSNGQIESGWYTGGGFSFPFYALGDFYTQSLLSNSPVRFHFDGSIHQVVLDSTKKLDSLITAKVTRTEMQYGFTQTLNLSPGDTFELPASSKLVFSNNNLLGFTHHEPTGLAFTYTIQVVN